MVAAVLESAYETDPRESGTMNDDSKKQAAIDLLKSQIREQRARIDPEVLKRAQAYALENNPFDPKKQGQAAKKPPAAETATAEPYDRESAAKAIELFLRDHKDRKGFQERLLAHMKKNDH